MIVGHRTDVLTDARGISYVIGADGKPVYLMPSNGGYNPQTHQIEQSPNTPHAGLLSDYHWDTKTGTFQRSTNWGNVAALAALGAIAAPAAVAAMPSVGAAVAGGAGVIPGTGIPAVAGTGAATVAPAAAGSVGGLMAGGWGTVLSKGFDLASGLYGTHAQASSARNAAQITAAASDRTAAAQQAALEATLAFQRQQAENTYANSEVDRHANYDQWHAREARIGSVGEALGYGSREIPAYVAGVDPHFTAPGAPVPPNGYVAPGTLPTYAPTTGANGLTPSGSGMAPVGAYLAPYTAPITPALAMPPPGSVGAFLDPRRAGGTPDPRLRY